MQKSIHDEPSILTDLCAIWAIKYTCPRCSMHTCSLPCVKKHKQWAQCSGVRDPAEYRKRGELATPTSIDKDFNFITGLERSLQRADNNATNRGIDLAPARTKPPQHLSRSKVDLEAEERNITIIRAPKGLSRSKLNRTHWHGATKCVLWTVEWLDDQENRRVNNVHEFKTIREAYVGTFGKKSILKRKRPSNDPDDCKRISEGSDVLSTGNKANLTHPGGFEASRPESKSTNQTHHTDETSKTTTPIQAEQAFQTIHSSNPNDTASNQPTTAISSKDKDAHSVDTELYFYLLRPNTEARYKVLIPLSPDEPLRNALSNRVIMEFPTLYVLSRPSDSLEKPFISEDEYQERHGKDIPINITGTQPPTLGSETGIGLEDGEIEDANLDLPIELNETKVLEVIAKDLIS